RRSGSVAAIRRERAEARREEAPRALPVGGQPLAAKVPSRGRVSSSRSARLKRRAAIPSPGSARDRGRSPRQPARARQVYNPLQSNLNRRIAERIRRAITTLKPDLMRPVSVRKAHEIVLCQLEAPACVRVGDDLSAWYTMGIELVVPRRVERVGPVDPFA